MKFKWLIVTAVLGMLVVLACKPSPHQTRAVHYYGIYYVVQYKQGWWPFWRNVPEAMIFSGSRILSDRHFPLLVPGFDEAVREATRLADPAEFAKFQKEQDRLYANWEEEMRAIDRERSRTFTAPIDRERQH